MYSCSSGGTLAKLNYLEIKQLMDRCSAQQKKGKLTDTEIMGLVNEWYDRRTEGDLNKAVFDREMKVMEAQLAKYNVEQLGEIPIKREDGTMRILECQMGGCAGKIVQQIKMSTTENLIQKYNITLAVFMELNFNWTKVNSSANLAPWLHQEERETRSIMAHNTQELDNIFLKHQPGGTGMVWWSKFLQYARKLLVDSRCLGCWFLWPFYCNPNHVTRIIVAYRTCHTKSKWLWTIYQQQLHHIQVHSLNCSPVELFDKDLSNQIKEWRKSGERIVLLMDVNDHPLKSKFYQRLKREQTELEEFTHKCWGPTPPYTHISGLSPINGGYKSPEIEIVQLGLLLFAESPGDHRSFIINVSTCSLLGDFRFEVFRPVSRRIVTSQQHSVDRYNQIVQEQSKLTKPWRDWTPQLTRWHSIAGIVPILKLVKAMSTGTIFHIKT
jgi:hypothetical protein